jgi:hypothetical protein
MNTWKTRTAAATAVVVGLGLGIAAAATAAPTPVPTPSPVSTTTASVDATVAQQLSYLREEERLAGDVYTAIAKLYPANATQFTRIATAEQRHFAAMGALLSRYGLADPSAGRSAGSYADPALTQLYDKLMTQAKVSLTEAYKVGVAIEQTDLADLKAGLAAKPPTDVKAVYTNLQAGSNNHLATFTALRDGKTLGTGNGTGMQNGRGANGTQATPGSSATATPGASQGARRGAGQGAGQGAGRNTNQTRPADCPLG